METLGIYDSSLTSLEAKDIVVNEKNNLWLERGCLGKSIYHTSMKTKFPPFGSPAFTNKARHCMPVSPAL